MAVMASRSYNHHQSHNYVFLRSSLILTLKPIMWPTIYSEPVDESVIVNKTSIAVWLILVPIYILSYVPKKKGSAACAQPR